MDTDLFRAAVLVNSERDPGNHYADIIAGIFRANGYEVDTLDLYNPPYPENVSFYAVIGGDGSMLRAARYASPLGIPIIGINLGHLGYMTELETDEIGLISNIMQGKYHIEKRMMLSVEVYNGGKLVYGPCHALNDAVISNGAVSRIVDIELICNGGRVGHYCADGLICATPTGSTAYSLSAGGPVIDPSIDCLCVTTVSPHSLKIRPMIFSPDVSLEIHKYRSTGGDLYLTADGSDNYRLNDGDVVKVTRSNVVTKLIRLKQHSFFDTLSDKMSE